MLKSLDESIDIDIYHDTIELHFQSQKTEGEEQDVPDDMEAEEEEEQEVSELET